MGNCCSSSGTAGAARQDLRHPSEERLANWRATGVVALRNAGLQELPGQVRGVPRARVLDASGNQLQQLPAGLPESLQRLVLSSNCISSLAGLEHLTHLKVLVLDNNQLRQLPDCLGQLARLEVFSVKHNQLAMLPASLGQLAALRQLAVAHNQLTALPDQLGSCTRLQELDASSNRLQCLPASLGELHELRVLLLDDNPTLRTLPPGLLEGCCSLVTLSVHGSTAITPEVLQSMPCFEAFEQRRRGKYSKVLAGGAMLGGAGMDEGVDRGGSRVNGGRADLRAAVVR